MGIDVVNVVELLNCLGNIMVLSSSFSSFGTSFKVVAILVLRFTIFFFLSK